MSTHADGIGFLIELREQISENWFARICDNAIDSTTGVFDENELSLLITDFIESNEYESRFNIQHISPPNHQQSSSSSVAQNEFLETVKEFENFKSLSNNLSIDFNKRITIFFGTNGSGKSSICESLKVLGSSNIPKTPIQNVKSSSPNRSKFRFKFKTMINDDFWELSKGFGLHSAKLKFFDSKLAYRYASNPMEPDKIIEVSPFRLEVFDFTKKLLNQFQQRLREILKELNNKLTYEILSFENDIREVKLGPNVLLLDKVRNGKLQIVQNFLSEIDPLKINEEKLKLDADIKEIQSLYTESGIKVLRREISDLKDWIMEIKEFNKKLVEVNLLEIDNLIRKGISLKQNQESILEKIVNPDIEVEKFKSFLESSTKFIDFNNLPNNCPYCFQLLGDKEIQLIANYKEFLFNEKESELKEIRKIVNVLIEKADLVRTYDLSKCLSNESIPQQIIDNCEKILSEVKSKLPINKKEYQKVIVSDFDSFIIQIEGHLEEVNSLLKKKEKLWKIVKDNKEELDKKHLEYTRLKKRLDLNLLCKNHSTSIIESTINSKYYHKVRSKFDSTSFQNYYTKITMMAKRAYGALIISGFESILSNEYLKLTEKQMDHFGVKLLNKGREGKVTLKPTIGQEPINIVMSEGELKIHALALFFCELESSNEDVIIMDDPVTSLDYNYVTSFVERLRDFIISHPEKQIIIFTHDWAFFDQLRDDLNKVHLSNDFEVKVIEKCSLLKGFKDRIPDLKTRINSLLSATILDDIQKKELAGMMRILIEAVVNKHVFANQKYKYKKGSTSVSNFMSCINLVPLKRSEAITLQDLFKKLSPYEHDDPRIWYIETDISKFQTRFDMIKTIEAQILLRK